MKSSYWGTLAFFASTLSAAAADDCITIDPARIAHEEGKAFIASGMTDSSLGDSNSAPKKSTLRLYENGKALGAAHSLHASIRKNGKGRFSHWNKDLYFSSSDNSDPRRNGRAYSYCLSESDPTPVVTPTPTPTATVTPKPSPTVTATPTPTATVTPKPSPVVTNNGIMGYATLSGGTTGGAGGETVTVSSCAQLRKAVEGNTPRIVKVSGSFAGNDEKVNIGSNKSIIGLPGATIRACGMYMFGESNVIIQNLILIDGNPTTENGGVGYSTWTVKEGSHHVWVDHVEMYPSDNPDNGHTMAGISNAADFVTVSWSKFYGKYTGLLIGASNKSPSDIGHLTVTLHHNLFEEMLERQPKVSYGTVHAFNNYYKNAKTEGHTPVGITAVMGAIIRTDANYFQNFNGAAISTRYNPAEETDGFISGLETNYKDSIGRFNITTPASNWMPPYDYSSFLTPVMSVPDVVMSGVGAILK